MNTDNQIVIDFGSFGTKSFLSVDDLRDWKDSERESWNWLKDIPKPDAHIASQIQSILANFFSPVDQLVNACNNLTDKDVLRAKQETACSRIQNAVKRQPMILSDSADCEFINELRQDDIVTAAHTAGAMLGVPMNPSLRPSVEGYFLYIAFIHGYRDRSKNERSALQHLQAEWRNLFVENREQHEAFSKECVDMMSRQEQLLSSQKSVFEEFKTSSAAEIATIVDTSKRELKNIETTYDSKLSVQSSVLYWKNKAKGHASAAKKLSWACGIVGVIVALFLGFETFIAIGPLQKVSELPLWKAAMLLLTAIVGIWSIRILVRLLLSNLHLKSDALERRTMLLTYLALLRRGQGPTEDQRELLLQILFRPSSTGIVKDDALPPLIAQWLNTITN